MSTATVESITVPEGFVVHRENSASILLPATDDGKEAFLNPVQEFNRDLSVACIRVWSEETARAKEAKWRERLSAKGGAEGKGRKGKKRKGNNGAEAAEDGTLAGEGEGEGEANEAAASKPADEPVVQDAMIVDSGEPASKFDSEAPAAAVAAGEQEEEKSLPKYRPQKFVILEALSATGLRSIRYAKEIPLVKYVIANDLSSSAVDAIKRNVGINGLGAPTEVPATSSTITDGAEGTAGKQDAPKRKQAPKAKVQINEGDACALMYSHRPEKLRVDCVDLDPYGTAAPFIDAAVQCVSDGGLLCVTCTDMSVLATNNYPEKCYSNYGGIPVKAEYCHEAALRLVLHTISTSAGRYGRYILPLVSLSIDFYVRLFVRISTAPIEVKRAASKTSTYYICSGCQSFYEQPLGKIVEKTSEKNGQVNLLYRQRSGPPVGDKCTECESILHVAGPMWSGPIHDVEFVSKVLEHVDVNSANYGTSTRMKGMLTVAKEELQTPFFFTPSRIAGFFHSVSPSLEEVSNALLHAGHSVSRSHASPGSLKTTATRQDVHDIFRCWVKTHPVKQEKISSTSPSHFLHAKEPRFEADFSHHPQLVTQSSKVKLVRYQQNPTSHWGPGTKAGGAKRKRDEDKS